MSLMVLYVTSYRTFLGMDVNPSRVPNLIFFYRRPRVHECKWIYFVYILLPSYDFVEVRTGFWWGRPDGRNHLEDLGLDGIY